MKIEELEQQKKQLITKYLQMQDMVDDYNSQIYAICCEIEKLNVLIVQKKKAATRASTSTAKSFSKE